MQYAQIYSPDYQFIDLRFGKLMGGGKFVA